MSGSQIVGAGSGANMSKHKLENIAFFFINFAYSKITLN
jgi:hypothetical protein